MGGVLSPCMLPLAGNLKGVEVEASGQGLSKGCDSSEECCQGSHTTMSDLVTSLGEAWVQNTWLTASDWLTEEWGAVTMTQSPEEAG